MPDLSNYDKLRADAETFYKTIGQVRCPAFNHEVVHFAAEGFNHLVYKRARGERNRNDQVMKFELLPAAKKIVETSTTYQEYDEGLTQVVSKKRKHRMQESAVVRYWGVVAIMDRSRVKVIVRQIGNGAKHFWSVIPAWNTNQYRDMRLKRLAKGDLAEDWKRRDRSRERFLRVPAFSLRVSRIGLTPHKHTQNLPRFPGRGQGSILSPPLARSLIVLLEFFLRIHGGEKA